MILVGAPLRHADPAVVEMRLTEAARFSGWLFQQMGKLVMSAPNMMHPIYGAIPFAEAENLNKLWCDEADELAILMLDGWQESSGLTEEVKWFQSEQKPIHYYIKTDKGYVRQ